MTSRLFPSTRLSLICSAAALAFSAQPALAAPDDADVIKLVRQHVAAQASFDTATLAAITADNYAEVSPLGEVDPREKMLAFYAPEKKTVTPDIAVEEPFVRVDGDTAVLIAKLAVSVAGPDGQRRQMALRASYVAKKAATGWKLLSAQYTGIAPKRPAP